MTLKEGPQHSSQSPDFRTYGGKERHPYLVAWYCLNLAAFRISVLAAIFSSPVPQSFQWPDFDSTRLDCKLQESLAYLFCVFKLVVAFSLDTAATEAATLTIMFLATAP